MAPAQLPAARRQTAPQGVVPPPVSNDKALHSGRAHLLRSILLPYLRKHAPDEIEQVEVMVLRVVGSNADLTEEELFEDLEVAFGAKVDIDPHDVS